jgi:hypothetical protein
MKTGSSNLSKRKVLKRLSEAPSSNMKAGGQADCSAVSMVGNMGGDSFSGLGAARLSPPPAPQSKAAIS